MIERHNPRRRTLMGETRLLSEWLADTYPDREFTLQFRIGTDPEMVGAEIIDEAERRVARNLNRRVDAVVHPPPDIVVVEATMHRPTDKIGRLQEYLLLLRATPEVKEWGPAPVVPLLLTAQHDVVAQELCRRLRIQYVFREPEWMGEYLAAYPHRKRRSPHAGVIEGLSDGP